MALVLSKRNRRVQECAYGCCTPVHGKNVRHIRRSLKHRERADVRREIANARNEG